MCEEDLKQERVDVQQNKEKVKAQLDSWQRNCHTLGKQVSLIYIQHFTYLCRMLMVE